MIINCNSKLLDLSTPKIMGIINLSTDSFYAEGSSHSLKDTLTKVEKHIMDGAEIIDIGAASSRPGSIPKSAKDELKILKPAIKEIRQNFPEILLSIDSYHPEVFEDLMEFEINIVNDISAFENEGLLQWLSTSNCAYVLMHKKGSTQNMQNNPSYTNIKLELISFFKTKLRALKSYGVQDIIIDPGYGFGKTLDNNYEILQGLEVFKILDCPILTGISRKSMIYKLLDCDSKEALNGTSALHMIALTKGSKLLRVHDALQASQCIKLYSKLQEF